MSFQKHLRSDSDWDDEIVQVAGVLQVVDVHKTFDHYKAWADFKAAGGVISQEVTKMDAVDFTF